MRPSTGLDWALAFLVHSNRQVRASALTQPGQGESSAQAAAGPRRDLPGVRHGGRRRSGGIPGRSGSRPGRPCPRGVGSRRPDGRRAQGGAGHLGRREGQHHRQAGGRRGAGVAGLGGVGRRASAFASATGPTTRLGTLFAASAAERGAPRAWVSRPEASTCGGDSGRSAMGRGRSPLARALRDLLNAESLAKGGRQEERRREQRHEARRDDDRRRRAGRVRGRRRRSPPSKDSSAPAGPRGPGASRGSASSAIPPPGRPGTGRRAGHDRGRAAGPVPRTRRRRSFPGVGGVRRCGPGGRVRHLGPAEGSAEVHDQGVGKRRAPFAWGEPSRTPLQVHEMPGGRFVR